MAKFIEVFSRVVELSDNTLAVAGWLSQEEARVLFGFYLNSPVVGSAVKQGFVRYGFAPEYVEDMRGEPCWYTGAKPGRGAGVVWIYALDEHTEEVL